MSGAHTATLSYDPLGRLWQVSSPSGTTRFVYDGAHDVVETDGSGNALRAFVWGPGADEPLVWWEGAGPKMLHADERGSIVSIADGSGNLIGINKYDEYGNPASTNTGRFQYTGQAWLSELGLYYYKARMYSPTLGRFLQADPAGYAAGPNRYEAMGGDPVNSADPSGMENDTVDEKIVQEIPRIDSPDLTLTGWRVGYNPFFGREAGGRLEAMAFERAEGWDIINAFEETYYSTAAKLKACADQGGSACLTLASMPSGGRASVGGQAGISNGLIFVYTPASFFTHVATDHYGWNFNIDSQFDTRFQNSLATFSLAAFAANNAPMRDGTWPGTFSYTARYTRSIGYLYGTGDPTNYVTLIVKNLGYPAASGLPAYEAITLFPGWPR